MRSRYQRAVHLRVALVVKRGLGVGADLLVEHGGLIADDPAADEVVERGGAHLRPAGAIEHAPARARLDISQVRGQFTAKRALEIAAAGRAITLLHPKGYDYFRLLRSKLHWGLGGLAHER